GGNQDEHCLRRRDEREGVAPNRRRESGDRRGSARGRVFWQSRSADRKRVLHADEGPQLARQPHTRLSDVAIYEFPPSREATRREAARALARRQNRERARKPHRCRSPPPWRLRSVARPREHSLTAGTWPQTG